MKQQIAILLFFPHRGRYLCLGPTIYRLNRFNFLFVSHYLTCVWGTFLSFFPLLDLFILLYWSLLCVWREFRGCLWALWRVPFGFDILFFECSLLADLTVTFSGCFFSLQVLSMVRVNKQRNNSLACRRSWVNRWPPSTSIPNNRLGLLTTTRLRKLVCYPLLPNTICSESPLVSLLQKPC